MSKSANAGELRTAVRFFRVERVTNDNGISVEVEVNIFGTDAVVYVKWANAHGTEVFAAMQLQIREPATITARWSPQYNERLIVRRHGDPEPYEVISVDNVEQRNTWCEMKLRRKEAAR
jgi:hypothetical protein